MKTEISLITGIDPHAGHVVFWDELFVTEAFTRSHMKTKPTVETNKLTSWGNVPFDILMSYVSAACAEDVPTFRAEFAALKSSKGSPMLPDEVIWGVSQLVDSP